MIKRFIDSLYFLFEFFFNFFPFFTELYIKFHECSVIKEIELANISRSDKILQIGCGAIPYTSVVIARETNAKVIGIDNKQSIVNVASRCIKRYNLSNIIKIKFGDGRNYDASDFDVFIISYGVLYQDLILDHVINSMKNKARIILRRLKIKNNEYICSTFKNFLVCSIKLLLNQESILFVKKIRD
jgi:precorrin-6B methylase 2